MRFLFTGAPHRALGAAPALAGLGLLFHPAVGLGESPAAPGRSLEAVPPLAGAEQPSRTLCIALAGQPNVGKSTVFNALTGLDQHVGNWPGKTVEQKRGYLNRGAIQIELVDLPGTYSLTARSAEEEIVRDYLLFDLPDVVIVLVGAATLERNLYLAAEILAFHVPLVIGVNMMDMAEREGVTLRPDVLQSAIGVPVVPLTAARGEGLEALIESAVHAARDQAPGRVDRPQPRAEHRPIIHRLAQLLIGHSPRGGPDARADGSVGTFPEARGRRHDERGRHAARAWTGRHHGGRRTGEYHKRGPHTRCGLHRYPREWLATKLLEGDARLTAMARLELPQDSVEEFDQLLHAHEDAFLDIVGGRYDWIRHVTRAAITRRRPDSITLTDRLDRIATHPFYGLVVLSAILGFTFWLIYGLATPMVDLLAGGTQLLATWARPALDWLPSWLTGLIVDGLLSGAGMVLTFMPVMVLFFAVLGVLEDVGYFARAAYVMDRFMHAVGLHGKSFLPLFLGFGCNVPAALGTRILEDRRSRLLTLLLTPLVPCTARLAVIAFLAPAFFGARAAWVSFLLVVLNVVVIALLGLALGRVVPRQAPPAFIMELPLYHLPTARTLVRFVWHNTRSFVEKAGSIILIASAAVWALAHLPSGDPASSVLAWAGRGLEPLGALMGLGDWRMITALLTSFVAKENTIATLGVLFAGQAQHASLPVLVAAELAPAAGLAFLVVQMLFIPCAATLSTLRQEAGWRWALTSVLMQLVISIGIGIAVFQVASQFGYG